VQAKDLENIFSKMMAKKLPNLEKDLVMLLKKVLEHKIDKTMLY
jgi:hypothetical protein